MKDTHIVVRVDGSIADIQRRLEKAVADRGYGLLAAINLQERMAAKGVTYPMTCIVFEICNPRRAKAVLELAPKAATVLPCRIALYEDDHGPCLGCLRPTVLMAGIGVSQVEAAALEVEKDMEAILEQAAVGASGDGNE